jgi:hypothetical protein
VGAGASWAVHFSSSVEGGIAAAVVVSFLFLPRDNVGVRARNFTVRPSGLRLRMGRSGACGMNLVAAFRLVFSRTVSLSCCTAPVSPTKPCGSHVTNRKTIKDEWDEGEGCGTHRFLASPPLGTLDHETPIFPYEHHSHGERYAACSTARNRAYGHGRAAA